MAIEDVLKYARTNKEKRQTESDLINDLRLQVQEQDRVLRMLTQAAQGAGLSLSGEVGTGERSALMGGGARGGYGTTSGGGEMNIEMGDLALRGATAVLAPRRAPEAVSGAAVGSKTIPVTIPTEPMRTGSAGTTPSLSMPIGTAAVASSSAPKTSNTSAPAGFQGATKLPARSGSDSSTHGSSYSVPIPVPRTGSKSFLGGGISGNSRQSSRDSLEGIAAPTPDAIKTFVFSQPSALPPRQEPDGADGSRGK